MISSPFLQRLLFLGNRHHNFFTPFVIFSSSYVSSTLLILSFNNFYDVSRSFLNLVHLTLSLRCILSIALNTGPCESPIFFSNELVKIYMRIAFVWQPVLVNENSEFKSVKPHLKIDLMLYPIYIPTHWPGW